MYKVKIKINHFGCWAKELSLKFDCKIYSSNVSNLGENLVLDILQIQTRDNHEKIIEFVKNQKTVTSIDILEESPDVIYMKVVTHYDTIISKVLKNDCFSITPLYVYKGDEFWEVITTNKDNVKNLINDLKEMGDCELLNLTEYNFDKNELTEKQSNVINYAFNKGYYDFPKKINLEQISNYFKLSKSTTAQHLKKAEKTIINDFLN